MLITLVDKRNGTMFTYGMAIAVKGSGIRFLPKWQAVRKSERHVVESVIVQTALTQPRAIDDNKNAFRAGRFGFATLVGGDRR